MGNRVGKVWGIRVGGMGQKREGVKVGGGQDGVRGGRDGVRDVGSGLGGQGEWQGIKG